ncbi:TonB-dependent receptor [Caenibius sp. WL]|uniref:TonB-dependent receptor n=1 Tax=Caenibius sp. WL TaxID=2872646 RepID=UPI001C9965B6|nr:TonB-dependent receptor [Caenibius sp. WL]QZP09261.1 TonB-dependent receptor [Caenibius sp. WL]
MKTTCFVPLIALAAAAPAYAESADDLSFESRADIIVTASRAVSEPREIGSAISVITRETLDRNQITFVKDALIDTPGVLVSTDRPGNYASVNIRGSNNDEVLWLVDGIPLGDPSAASTEFRADHLIAADIAQIEVLRGNQSSLYGSDAIGGVINIITQRAIEEGIAVNAEAEAGSHGTLNGGASLLGKSGPVDFRLTATGYRHDGPSLTDPRTATRPASEKDAYRRYGFSGRMGVEASPNLRFQMNGFWADTFSDLDNTGSDSLNTVRKREYAVSGQGLYASSDDRLTVRLTGSRYVARRLYFGSAYRPEGDLYRGTKDTLALDARYDTGGLISLAAGGALEREKSDQATFHSGDFNARISTRSAYGELALRPAAGLTLTGAARIDDNSRFGTFDTYRGTVAYAAGPVKFRASYGTGAKAPGLYQLFDPTYGNPHLKAEKSRGGDIGADIALSDTFSASASYFFLRKTNEIEWNASIGRSGGYRQWGRTRAHGVELGLTARPLAWLTVSQSFTYTDHEAYSDAAARYRDSGRPEYAGTTAITVLPAAGAEFTARVRYRDGDASTRLATRAYAVVDLLGSYRINGNVELFGRVTNLFDKWYQMYAHTNTLGRSAYGGVRVSF